MVSKNLDRRRNRTLGRSKKIPDISVEIMPASVAIASGTKIVGPARYGVRTPLSVESSHHAANMRVT
jgi:hypothetical protein